MSSFLRWGLRIFNSLGPRRLLAAIALLLCYGSIQRAPVYTGGTLSITTGTGPYIGGSPIDIQTSGGRGKVAVSIIGPGDYISGVYHPPVLAKPTNATIVAATPFAYATRELQLVPPPPPGANIIAVASYGSGIALHDASTFALIGIVPSAEPPGDVAIAPNGDIYAPLTDATTMLAVTRSPWSVGKLDDVPLGNEIVIDPGDGAMFVSNRDVDGKGALTRVAGGVTRRIITGITAEGLALDSRGHHIFVGNVNEDVVLEVDTRTMEPVARIASVPRTFGIALDDDARNLFVVSNQNRHMRPGGGYLARIDLRTQQGRIAARSGNMPFPVGVAYDAKTNAVFVADEDSDQVYVLDAQTLAPRHAPLKACALPWRPHIDERQRRLYVPCAKANRIAAYNLDTLSQLRGSPFATGNYPLGVATSN